MLHALPPQQHERHGQPGHVGDEGDHRGAGDSVSRDEYHQADDGHHQPSHLAGGRVAWPAQRVGALRGDQLASPGDAPTEQDDGRGHRSLERRAVDERDDDGRDKSEGHGRQRGYQDAVANGGRSGRLSPSVGVLADRRERAGSHRHRQDGGREAGPRRHRVEAQVAEAHHRRDDQLVQFVVEQRAHRRRGGPEPVAEQRPKARVGAQRRPGGDRQAIRDRHDSAEDECRGDPGDG